MRPVCYFSLGGRIAVVPLVWWGILGFGRGSGTEWLHEYCGLGPVESAAVMALFLGAVSVASLLPCGIHRRVLRGRAAACQCSGPGEGDRTSS